MHVNVAKWIYTLDDSARCLPALFDQYRKLTVSASVGF